MGVFVNAATVNVMLDWLTGKTTPAAVATRYITTYNGDPQGAGSENISTLTGSANRQAITGSMAAAASGSAASNADITFTNSAVGGATVNFVAIFSAITGGTLMASVAVTSKTIAIGDSLKILSGNLTFSIA
jgi:hypothetical protein